MIQFPQGFLWGAATSSYQVEGNNQNSDWWEWEKTAGLKEVSGQACRHYELYPEDFSLASTLNHNAHRLSIEWSRIQPEEGKFSKGAIKHYQDVVSTLREYKLEPIVTLHHFTNPLWFAKLGGWQNKKAADYFLSYAEKITEALCEKVHYWITINEPLVYIYHAYLLGVWPPQEKSFLKARRVLNNVTVAHIKAYRLIHNIYKKKGLRAPSVSIAKNLQAFVPCSPTIKNRFATYLRNKEFNFGLIKRLIRHKALDFIGINYYSRSLVEVKKWSPYHLAIDVCEKNHHILEKNSLGWDIYPEGLYDLLLKLKKFNLPIIITENGICTDDDSQRWRFIYEHLKVIFQAIEKGVEICGYIYWSFLDNYEWDKGFVPHFGLIGIDYLTYKRTIRESARRFALVCKTGVLDYGI
jgi:beta-glucosidase